LKISYAAWGWPRKAQARRAVVNIQSLAFSLPIRANAAMEILNQFMAYAEAFEKTYADDDWSRLQPYFAEDAVYEVQSEVFGCSLRGPEAILAGLKKSVNGFDRKFAQRTIDVTAPPRVDGDELSLDWTVTYQQEGLTPFVLRGSSRAQFRDGKIIALVDSYDSSVTADAVAWQQANGVVLDPSYT